MTLDSKNIFLKIFLLAAVPVLSLLFCTLALATPEGPLENDRVNWVFINDESIIDAPISTVALHFKDVQKSDTMIPMLKDKKILKQISDNERIDYDLYELPWPFKDRYAIYHATEKNLAGRKIIFTVDSLENYPFEEKGKIAVRIKQSNFRLKSLPEDEMKTRVTIKLTLDPGGFVPVWLINLKAKTWSKSLFKNLRKGIRKDIARKNILQTSLTPNAIMSPSSSF